MKSPKQQTGGFKGVYPIEFDALYVYIGGKRERITRRENNGLIEIHRYPNRKSVIGHQVKEGYIYFKHLGKQYKGFFQILESGKYGITKLIRPRAKR